MAHEEVLRIRVIKAVVEDGLSRNEAARVFRVGIATTIRWVNAIEQTHRAFADRRGPAFCAKAASGLAPGAAAQGE
jgi:transposase